MEDNPQRLTDSQAIDLIEQIDSELYTAEDAASEGRRMLRKLQSHYEAPADEESVLTWLEETHKDLSPQTGDN